MTPASSLVSALPFQNKTLFPTSLGRVVILKYKGGWKSNRFPCPPLQWEGSRRKGWRMTLGLSAGRVHHSGIPGSRKLVLVALPHKTLAVLYQKNLKLSMDPKGWKRNPLFYPKDKKTRFGELEATRGPCGTLRFQWQAVSTWGAADTAQPN